VPKGLKGAAAGGPAKGAVVGAKPRAGAGAPPHAGAMAGAMAGGATDAELGPIGAQSLPPVRFWIAGLRFHSIFPPPTPGLILRFPAKLTREASRLSCLINF